MCAAVDLSNVGLHCARLRRVTAQAAVLGLSSTDDAFLKPLNLRGGEMQLVPKNNLGPFGSNARTALPRRFCVPVGSSWILSSRESRRAELRPPASLGQGVCSSRWPAGTCL